MIDFISPKYLMKLINNVNEHIWNEYGADNDVLYYIQKWHIVQEEWNNYYENFTIKTKPSGEIDLLSTLHTIDGKILLQIAVDIGVETPDFIPSVATFRNEIKTDYKNASATFEKAFKQIEVHPDIAIGLANSALESIIKEILKDDRINIQYKENDTLYDLTSSLLKEFHIFPNSGTPAEIKTIGSSLLAINKSIETVRSKNTNFHGKTDTDYLIQDSLYTYFIVNSVTTIGLFLNTFYKSKLPKVQIEDNSDNLPF